MSTKPLWKTGTPPEDWDTHQTTLSAHFLQQRGWALFQAAQDKQLFYAATKHWSWMAVLETSTFGSRLYAPYGPTASSPSALKQAIEALKDCAEAQNADFIRIEPQAPQAKKILKQLKARRAHRDIQQKNTLVKDLTQSDDELFAEMMSTNRRLYRRAAETGFTFESTQDPRKISLFLDMIHQVAARTGIQPHSDRYFTTMAESLLPAGAATFHIASHNGKPVATAFTFENERTRYYAHAAAAESARKLQPSVYLVGHLIFDAKRLGKSAFDYNGVAPPHAPKSHPWAGFSQFKRSFGGNEVEYVGTWEIPIKKARYQAYRLLVGLADAKSKSRKFAQRTLRKVKQKK